MAATPVCTPDAPFRSILVATDFSEVSHAAAQYGVAVAQMCGANFCLLHVVSGLGFTLAGPDATARACMYAERDAGFLERQLVWSGALAGLRHRVIVRDGNIAQQVEQTIEDEHIDLVVVGTRARTGLARLVLGSVAEQIFCNAACPVLTVGPYCSDTALIDDHRVAGPILFATDFSEASLAALPYAASLANRVNARLGLLHMLSFETAELQSAWRRRDGRGETDAQRTTKQWLRRLAHGLRFSQQPLYLTPFGSLDDELFQVAENLNATAIVIGVDTAGHTSKAYKVASLAPCPVFSVGCGLSNNVPNSQPRTRAVVLPLERSEGVLTLNRERYKR